MITKSDVLKAQVFEVGITFFAIEVLALIVWRIVYDSFNLWLIAAMVITVAITYLGGVNEMPKSKIINRWRKLGLPLRAFPITAEQREATTQVAQKMLCDLAHKATAAIATRKNLQREKCSCESKFYQGFRGLESTPAREEARRNFLRAEQDYYD